MLQYLTYLRFSYLLENMSLKTLWGGGVESARKNMTTKTQSEEHVMQESIDLYQQEMQREYFYSNE